MASAIERLWQGQRQRAEAALRRDPSPRLILRPYQAEAVAAVENHWASGGTAALVEAATGTGKAAMIAGLIRSVRATEPKTAVLMLVHVRELVAQNAAALLHLWPEAPLGINSAGLGTRNRSKAILYASIQSVWREDAYSLGRRGLVVIDEAHLVPRSGAGMYRRLLASLRTRVPDLRVAGFTATAERTDSGRLDAGDDRLFDRVVYSYDLGRGVREGILVPLVPATGDLRIDVRAVPIVNGDFQLRGLAEACDRDPITREAIDELLRFGADRRSWLAFAASVDHAYRLREAIRGRGIAAETITAGMPAGARDAAIAGFRSGAIRCLTNYGVLTTGFDAPGTDLIAMLRPTLSRTLYLQMLGRGTRRAPDKTDCIVLDPAGNIDRHGPPYAWRNPAASGGGIPYGSFRIEALGTDRCRFACTPHHVPPDAHRFCGRPTQPGPGNPHGSWCALHRPVVQEAARGPSR